MRVARSWQQTRSLMRSVEQLHWGVMLLVLALTGMGIAMQYSAAGGNIHPWAFAQGTRFIPGLIAMLVLSSISIGWLYRWTYIIYGACLALLVVVDVMGHIGMGAQRWITFGGVNLQPSELMKLATIMALARYFHTRFPNEKPNILHLLVPLALIVMPCVLILRQPNLGTATILTVTGAIIFFAAGVRWVYFISVGAVALMAAPIAWQFLHEYQKKRVLTFLNPEEDPLGSGYNIIQSMIAVGSGGLSGKGFLQGSQGQLDFLPEKQTDFIFTMLAEEFGFLGSMTLLLCFALLITYALGIAMRSRHRFGSLIATGFAGMIFLHVFINIGMSMGMLPVVGVPLPLLSYGGTMLITTLVGVGLLMNVWVHRDSKL